MDEIAKPLSKEERVAVRWQRICARREKDSKNYSGVQDGGGVGVDAAVSLERLKTKEQITKSRCEIAVTRNTGHERVTQIRAESESQELERKERNERNAKDRERRISVNATRSLEIDKEIEEKWPEISKRKSAETIYDGIKEQNALCNDVLKSKDEIISEFSQQLQRKNEDYVELLSNQESDVCQMIKRMHNEYKAMKDEHSNQLTAVESSHMKEREFIIQRNKELFNSLLEKRRRIEMNFNEAKNSRDEEYHKELENIRLSEREKCNTMRIELETNIQLLEQKLEEMKGTSELNREKLDYNLQVLQEGEEESKDDVSQHKKKLKRLKEAVSSMKEKYEQNDRNHKKENVELSEEYKRLTKQYKELQKKFKHFVNVDMKKYREVWEMKEEQIRQLVGEVLQADKIIHEEILGYSWTPPLSAPAGPPGGNGIAGGGSTKIGCVGTVVAETPLSRFSTSIVSGRLPGTSLTNSTCGIFDGFSGNQAAFCGENPLFNCKFTDEQIKQFLAVLSVEASFLVGKRVVDALGDLETEEQRMLCKADSILRALGIEDREDLEEIVSLFYDKAPNGEQSSLGDSLCVKPSDFVKEIRRFVVNRQTEGLKSNEQKVKAQSHGIQERNERRKNRDREFWDNFSNVITPEKFRVWAVLLRALEKYNALLEARAKLVEEANALKSQNEELKTVLKGHFDSDVNTELIIPPIAMHDHININSSLIQ